MLHFLFTHTPLAFLVQSFWRDEGFTYVLAKRGIADILALTAADFNPPFYYFFIHFWMKIFGSSEISLRSVSLIFFLATIYVSMHFIEDIFKIKTKKVWIYILLIFLNPLLGYYAFEARMYTMFAFFSTLSFYSFYTKKKRLYFLSTVLGLYTHYFMIFVLFAQGLYIFLTHKKKSERMLELKHTLVKPLLFFAPWFVFVLVQKKFFLESFWIERSNLRTLIDLPAYLLTGYEAGITTNISPNLLTFISLLLWIILLWGFKWFKKLHKHPEHSVALLRLLLIWGLLIPAGIVIVSFIKPIFFPRYLLFAIPGLLLMFILLLESLPKKIKIVSLLILLTISVGYSVNQIETRRKEDMKKTISEVKALAGKNDRVFVEDVLDYFTVVYYLDEDRVFILNNSYETIPAYVGKTLIPKEKLTQPLPFYPRRGFIINQDRSYNIQALY